jgi:hypothetical protein
MLPLDENRRGGVTALPGQNDLGRNAPVLVENGRERLCRAVTSSHDFAPHDFAFEVAGMAAGCLTPRRKAFFR